MSIKSAFRFVKDCERVAIVFHGCGVWLEGYRAASGTVTLDRIGDREAPHKRVTRKERLEWADKVIKELSK